MVKYLIVPDVHCREFWKTPVKNIEGKYGIIIGQDINGNTVRIAIPEPDILFGVPIEHIESFLISNSL